MKIGVYNEVAAGAAGLQAHRPAGEVDQRRARKLSSATRRRATTSPRPSSRSTRTAISSALRVKTIANIGAYLQPGDAGLREQSRHAGRRLPTPAIHVDVTAVFTNTNPVRPYRGNGRPEAAYVIERMVDVAADRARHRSGRAAAPQLHPARRHAVQDRRSPSPTTAASSRRTWTWRSRWPTRRASRSAARKRASAASCAASASPTPSSAPAAPGYEGAEIRFDRAGAVTLFSGSINQGQGHETVFKQIVCDRLGLDPKDVHYVQGDTDMVFFGEGTGGSRSATSAARRSTWRRRQDRRQGAEASPRTCSRSTPTTSSSRTACSPSRKTNQYADHEGSRASPPRTRPSCRTTWSPASSPPRSTAHRVNNYPNGCHVCELEIDEETGEVEIVRYSVVDDVGTVINPLLLKGQIHRRRRAGRRPDR